MLNTSNFLWLESLFENMTRIVGILTQDEDGTLCLKTQLSPNNPEIYDVPLSELFEEFMDKKVVIDILPVQMKAEEGGKKK